jgi:hypothetical protein
LAKVNFYLKAKQIGKQSQFFFRAKCVLHSECVSFFINAELCLFNYLLFRVTHACSIFSCVHIFLVFTLFLLFSYQPNPIFLLFSNLHIIPGSNVFLSRVFFSHSAGIFLQIKMWKWKKLSPEVKPSARKCKLIKSYNSYWHKSLYLRNDGANVIGNCFSAYMPSTSWNR